MDSFELHKLQKEAELKRMKRENRFVIQDASSIRNLNSPKHSVIENFRRNNIKLHRSMKDEEKIKITRNFIRPTSNEPEFESLSDRHDKLMIRDRHSGENSMRQRYTSLINTFRGKYKILEDDDKIVSRQASHYILRFLYWFKLNKFEYLLQGAHIFNETESSLACSTKKGIKRNILKVRYGPFRKDFAHSITKSQYEQTFIKAKNIFPTHIVEQTTKIGLYLVSAKLKNLSNNDSSIAILSQVDLRFTLKENDILSIPSHLVNHICISGHGIPVVSNWHLL